MDRADVHAGKALNVSELGLVHAGDAVLEFGGGLVCERKGDGVLGRDAVRRTLANDVHNPCGDDARLAGTGTGDDLEVAVQDVYCCPLCLGVVHVTATCLPH